MCKVRNSQHGHQEVGCKEPPKPPEQPTASDAREQEREPWEDSEADEHQQRVRETGKEVQRVHVP